jgi:pSer/pThr/pTyr-binding forkhead associated (FHA) protein
MQAVLVMFRSDGERRSFSIARDMTVIGRREDCDLRIPLGEISRKHCRLVRDGDALRLEDLGSSNGTFHNGERIQEVTLNPGDSIQIGPVVFVVQIDGVPADEELQPVEPQATTENELAAADLGMGPLSPTAQSEVDDRYAFDSVTQLETESAPEAEQYEEEVGEQTGSQEEEAVDNEDGFDLLEDDSSEPPPPDLHIDLDMDAQQPNG